MGQKSLNFYVGQCVESRSFELGYRGAWWRCKIIKISRQQHNVFHTLKYLDFPDEKTHKIKVYQRCPGANRSPAAGRHLMVRPQYPPVYQQNEGSNISGVSEYLVVDNDWKVGDLVDWWKDDVYWPGKITEIFEDETVEIELVPPPFGEGSLYVAPRNVLRPSLNWSFNHGWSVPVSQDGGKGRRCAQLIKHKQLQGKPVCSEALPASHVKDKAVETTTGSVCEIKEEDNISMAVETTTGCLSETKEENNTSMAVETTTGSVCETKKEDNISMAVETTRGCVCETKEETNISMAVETTGSVKEEDNISMPLNSSVSDTIEAALLDLEELVNKINWIKSLLEDDKPSSGGSKSWKFVEHIASSTTPR